jgi:hypothetical protein
MNSERQKLIEQVGRLCTGNSDSGTTYDAEEIADFILADRQRILAPLVEIKNKFEPDAWAYFAKSGHSADKMISAIDATLRLAGLTGKE